MSEAYIRSYNEGEGYKYFLENVPCLSPMPATRQYVKKDDIIINWGNGHYYENWQTHWLNTPANVYSAVNKLTTFKILKLNNIPIPEYTYDYNQAIQWIRQEYVVLCRTSLEGNSGRGIIVAKTQEQLIENVLYVKHLHHHDEYRVHVFKGKVINAGIKIKARPNADPLIRIYNNDNWLVSNINIDDENNMTVPLFKLAIKGVEALKLDFGTCDIVYTPNIYPYWFILEINTAPGSGHFTFTRFAKAFTSYIKKWKESL